MPSAVRWVAFDTNAATTSREKSSEFVRRDFERVPVGIVKIDRVRDLVILEFEFDSALFQFALRGKKIFMVSAKGQVKHSKFAMT